MDLPNSEEEFEGSSFENEDEDDDIAPCGNTDFFWLKPLLGGVFGGWALAERLLEDSGRPLNDSVG